MALSARNRLSGTVETDGVIAEVVVELGDGRTITRASAEHLDLAEGDAAAAVVKASEARESASNRIGAASEASRGDGSEGIGGTPRDRTRTP